MTPGPLGELLSLLPQGAQAPLPPTGGLTRGSMGATGSRPYMSRNSDKGLDKERKKLMQSPVMQAFMRRSRQRLLW